MANGPVKNGPEIWDIYQYSCLTIMVMDDLYLPCRKMGQGHRGVIIYVYIVVL